MCGRYTLTQPEHIADRFQTLPVPINVQANYNVAPTQTMPVVINDGRHNVVDLMEWGLVPSWSKDQKFHPINARAEGLEDKPMFRGSFKYHRCLIPADGYYEWKRSDGAKQPYYFTRSDHQLFAFAGLWSTSHDPVTQAEQHTFTIVTSAPNPLMQPIHDRMPVILKPDHEQPWLDPDLHDPVLLHSFLTPVTDPQMQLYPVSLAVNSTQANDSTLIWPQS